MLVEEFGEVFLKGKDDLSGFFCNFVSIQQFLDVIPGILLEGGLLLVFFVIVLAGLAGRKGRLVVFGFVQGLGFEELFGHYIK